MLRKILIVKYIYLGDDWRQATSIIICNNPLKKT